MKVLGIVVLVVIVVGVIGWAFTLPAEFTAEDSALIACPPESLYVRFASPRTWARWSSWNARRDSTLAYTYTGPDSGVGATMAWTSRTMGAGSLAIVEAVPGRLVRYELRFPGGAGHIAGRVALEPRADGTQVTWRDAGRIGNNPLVRYLYGPMRKMMHQAYETSFAGLRGETEARVAAGAPK